MSLVLPREEEVENIFSRILSSKQSCERLMETFYDMTIDIWIRIRIILRKFC